MQIASGMILYRYFILLHEINQHTIERSPAVPHTVKPETCSGFTVLLRIHPSSIIEGSISPLFDRQRFVTVQTVAVTH